MAISKVKLANILVDNEYLNGVFLKFAELDYFHPKPASKFVDSVCGLTTLSDENPIIDVLTHFSKALQGMGMTLPVKDVKSGACDLEDIRKYTDSIHERFENGAAIHRELEIVIQENYNALTQVRNIESTDLNLDDLLECKYIKIRFGKLPVDNAEKLQYYHNRPFVSKLSSTDDTYSWCTYFITARHEGDVDNTFPSLYFECIRIPGFVHGNPIQARENLQEEIDNDLKQLQHANEATEALKAECIDNFADTKAELEFINHTFEARKYVLGLGERFSTTGFVVEEDVPKLKESFSNLKEVEIEVRLTYSGKRLSPSTKLKNGWFVRPFSMSVEMYDTPEHEGTDPTSFVAFTYPLLFGVMFGDLGQGFVSILVGYLFYKWKGMWLGGIGMRIGIFSSIFGIVYGSVFGNEELLDSLCKTVFGLSEKSVKIMTSNFVPVLLAMAVGLGVVLVVISIGINLYLRIKSKNHGELFFSQNGVAGLVFYISLVGGGAYQLLSGVNVTINPVFATVFLLVLLVLIFLKEALERKMEKKEMFPDGSGGFSVESSFELFEICLSSITNTISYPRVGGFVPSYAGMMMAVTLIVDMAGGAGWIVMIFGNIFVVCLEGVIAGIQVLRLEFYEMFSRYFTGNGIMFKSLNDQREELSC